MCTRTPQSAIEAADDYSETSEFDRYAFPGVPSDGEIRAAFEEDEEPPFCRGCGDTGCVRCLGMD